MLKLIDFWRIARHKAGDQTILRPHHYTIARNLTSLFLGQLDTPNLMILMPPRCSKTDLGIKGFGAWTRSFFPDAEDILASYALDLAVGNSTHIRSTLSQEWYRSLICSEFGARIEMRGDNAGGRQDFFKTDCGGTVKAVGTGGGITGFGAGKLRPEWGGFIGIDDPIKANDAKSAAIRKACIEWYQGTLKSRRNRTNTPLLLVMQRVHPADLAGWILQNEREDWTVVQIPALDENNQSIWEDRISTESLLRMKEVDPETFWSQYMQNPTQNADTIFKEDYWQFWNDRAEAEKGVTVKFITADTAFKAKDSSDWSVLQCWGCEGTAGLTLIDQVRGRWEFPELLAQSKAFWEKHSARRSRITPATEFWIEDKASGISLQQTLRSEVKIPARAWEPPKTISPDKVGRAKQSVLSISQGRIRIPHYDNPGYSWVNGFMNEHSSFTNDDSHLFDDQVDTQTMATLIWVSRGGGQGPLPSWIQ